jgi:transcriptional regulator with XRE-family HTH domain
MDEQGISQQRLARLTGMSQSRLSRRMTGEVGFTFLELHAIAAALGKPLIQFLNDEPATAEL